MSDCNCTFVYHSVIPPTHCPKCGRCLGCGQGFAPQPIYPQPWPTTPWVNPWPYTQWPSRITYTTSGAAAQPNSFTINLGFNAGGNYA